MWVNCLYNSVGPIGTAVCVYRADIGDTRGILEVFSEDVLELDLNTTETEVENFYIDCDKTRPDNAALNQLESVQTTLQVGEDPLLVLDGVT